MVQLVKNPPAMWETWVQSLGWEDPLEKGRLHTLVFWPDEQDPVSPKVSFSHQEASISILSSFIRGQTE